MGSIFGDPAVVQIPRTKRQLDYLKTKKTDRKKVQKREQALQIDYCDWLRETFPGIHFRSDTGSGAFNSKYEKNTHNRQQSSTDLPDITIFAARRGYHALTIELKDEGVNLKMMRNGTKIRIRRDRNGRIIERDYKIRLKGDWASLHIENQSKRIDELREAGYCALFGVGIEQLKKITCWYFDVSYIQPQEMF